MSSLLLEYLAGREGKASLRSAAPQRLGSTRGRVGLTLLSAFMTARTSVLARSPELPRRRGFVLTIDTRSRDHARWAIIEDMHYRPIGMVDRDQLAEAIAEAAKSLDSRDVRDVSFRLGEDHDGEPSIFFGILLSRSAGNTSRIGEVTGRISAALGLLPYFNYTATPAHFKNPGWM